MVIIAPMESSTRLSTTKNKNTLTLHAPFILRFGDDRQEVKEQGRLELSVDVNMGHNELNPLEPPTPLSSARQEMKLWIGDRLTFEASGWGVREFGRYFKPDEGLPELYLDPLIVRSVA